MRAASYLRFAALAAGAPLCVAKLVNMVDELRSFLDTVTVEDKHAVFEAATEYIKTIHNREIHEEVRTAADNAINAGDGAATWQFKDLVSRPITYGPIVKNGTARLLRANPRYLKYFSPRFASGVLSRFQSQNGNGAHH